MARTSAGLLMYRVHRGALEVLLVHPGGPYWTDRDLGAWSVPKGEYDPPEDPLEAAKREFEEETGLVATGRFLLLTPLKQRSGKVISVWAFEGDCDPTIIHSNTFSMEWPPRSGKQQSFPEVDRAEWFSISVAKGKINKGQVGFLDELASNLKSTSK